MTRRRLGTIARWSVAVATPVALVVIIVITTGAESTDVTSDADLRNGRVFIQDNLWSTDTQQYAVWVAPDGTPFVGVRARTDGRWRIEDLGKLPGNPLSAPTADDEHNVYAIAVDARGYVHVVGNMHNDALRYVRSRHPRDVTSWVTGRLAGPTTDVTYPRFVGLPDGTLLFVRREGRPAAGAVLVDALPPGASSWERRGVVLDGTATGESLYIHDVAVDPRSGAVHLLAEWRAGSDVATTNDVSYARSDDGGRSWTTSDGRLLELPITHATAEIVWDTAPSGSGLLNDGGLAVDVDGRPHAAVVVERPGGERSIRHLWRGRNRWHQERLPGHVLAGRPAVAAMADGTVWFLGTRDGRLAAVDVTSGTARRRREAASIPRRWEVTYDTQALARHGDVEILVPRRRVPRVITVDL